MQRRKVPDGRGGCVWLVLRECVGVARRTGSGLWISTSQFLPLRYIEVNSTYSCWSKYQLESKDYKGVVPAMNYCGS